MPNLQHLRDKVNTDDGKDFMLSELNNIREQIKNTRSQFDTALNIYFTGLGILTTGILLLVNNLQSSPVPKPLTVIFGIVTWGLSFFTYIRLCRNRVNQIREILVERKLQEYFLSKQSDIRKYANLAVNTAKIEEWSEVPRIGLSRFIIVFFVLFATCIGVLASIVTILILVIVFENSGIPKWNYDSFHLFWYTVSATLPFILVFVMCARILVSNHKDALDLGRKIFGQFHS